MVTDTSSGGGTAGAGGGWRRHHHVGRLERPADLCIVGGGIVGAGVALDAAARGMSVVLLEQDDFAAGTSGRSSKLLHGGVRYLPQLRFGLIRESLQEQRVLTETAAHLVVPTEFVMPLYRGRGFGDVPRWLSRSPLLRPGLRLGLWLYDRLGRGSAAPRRITVEEALSLVPGLRREGLQGALAYRDARTDDARLVLAVLKAAVARGAIAVNHLRATSVAAGDGGYVVVAEDRLGGPERTLRTGAVVTATGAFRPPAPTGVAPPALRHSLGTHLVVERSALGMADAAVVLPETEDGRVLYVIPWQGKLIVGTTDVPAAGDVHPAPPAEDIAYLTRHLDRYFSAGPVRPLTAWAGMRALVPGRGGTAAASREHQLHHPLPGYVQVAGGKLTGYRRIAAEVTDLVADHLSVRQRADTAHLPLAGADGSHTPDEIVAAASRLGLSATKGANLHGRYGSEAMAVLQLVATRPALGRACGDGTLLAEAVYGVREECAVTIADLALRRTRLSWLTPDHGREDAPVLAAVLGAELGWDEATEAAELERFAAVLAAEGL